MMMLVQMKNFMILILPLIPVMGTKLDICGKSFFVLTKKNPNKKLKEYTNLFLLYENQHV